MSGLDTELTLRLEALRRQGLYRELRRVDSPQSTRIEIEGKSFLNFSSNDYLGLATEPILREAASRAVEQFGTGSGASRLISGSLAPHDELEKALAAFKGTEAALSFATGYATALGVICALMEKRDVVVIDELVHASIVDAARLSGAKLRVFKHNDLADLEDILRWADRRHEDLPDNSRNRARTLIVTESVFSMDGDQAPLNELVAIKEQYGAWLMLDEAHATGLYGPHRRGLADQFGVGNRIEIQMGTLGKALGASGGYVCGSRVLVDYLVNRARSFIFSTAPVPAAAAAATAGIRFVQSRAGRERCERLWRRVSELNASLERPASAPNAAIIPILMGEADAATAAAALLRERGIYVPAIRFPTVPRDKARLRVSVTANHTADDIRELAAALAALDSGVKAMRSVT
jgi:8-amino-7-oxononanoate synthase